MRLGQVGNLLPRGRACHHGAASDAAVEPQRSASWIDGQRLCLRLHAGDSGVRDAAGGLMSYGPNWPSMWRRAADLVDKILRGANPAELPVEQPTEFRSCHQS